MLIVAGLNQDATYFAISDEYIIGPLDDGPQAAGALNGFDDGKRSKHHEQMRGKERPE